MTNTDVFCRILRDRSIENNTAVSLLLMNQLYGKVISALREELDSMVRVIFLLQIPIIENRNHYINQTIANIRWTYPNSRQVVTDSDMVNLSNNLQGWIKSVYKFGCAFIHLSSLADYKNENPFLKIPLSERDDVKRHLHDYHGFSLTNDLNMDTVTPYLERVFAKVSNNLASYIYHLEGGRTSPL